MPIQLDNLKINWYQYLNDNEIYRTHIKTDLKRLLENTETQQNYLLTLSHMQCCQTIDLLNRIDYLLEHQFMITEIFSYHQLHSPNLNCNFIFDNYLQRILKRIYNQWPKTCPLPTINNRIEYENELIVDFTPHNNPHQYIPEKLIQLYQSKPIRFDILLHCLKRDHIYQPKIGKNKIYQPPSKSQLYKTLKKLKQHPENNREYRHFLIRLLLLFKYQKKLKQQLLTWYQKNQLEMDIEKNEVLTTLKKIYLAN